MSCVPRSSQVARQWSLPRRGTQARGASRPASKFVDGSPCLAARVRESVELTATSHRSYFFCSSRDSRDEAALSKSVTTGSRIKKPKRNRTLCPSMAHSSSDGHVGFIVWPQIEGSRKNPGMPSQYLMCPEVALSQRIHL